VAIQSRVVDDVDLESDATEVVRIGLDGKWVVLDLNDPHAQQLREEIGAWWPFGRPENKPRAEVKSKAGPATKAEGDWWGDPDEATPLMRKRCKLRRVRIREWGEENGWDSLASSGRVPRALAEAFRAAHPDDYAWLPELPEESGSSVLAMAK
jgi:hypothetical protein